MTEEKPANSLGNIMPAHDFTLLSADISSEKVMTKLGSIIQHLKE